MNLIYAVLAFLLAILLVLAGISRVGSWLIERRNPPVGSFADINGARLHYVHIPAPSGADLPPIVFIHGATANLKDQMIPLRPLLEGRAEMLFLDRPGHGWSSRGDNENPSAQAAAIAALMDRLGMAEAIIVGHSFGGATAATFALEQAGKTAGLVFLAAATHPWPGGRTSWYYRLTTRALHRPAVFGNHRQSRRYGAHGGGDRLRVRSQQGSRQLFRAGVDPAGAEAFGLPRQCHRRRRALPPCASAPRRATGKSMPRPSSSPAISDTVVYEEIHSTGLARDIPGAELVWVRNLGHKPDWIAPDLVVAAIEKLAGKPRDVQAVARMVEARIADDRFGAHCVNEEAPSEELAPI